MDLILEEIEKAKKLELYYVALAMVLTLPDVCAYLELSRAVQPNDYKNWCKDNLDLKKIIIDENILYQFRCRLSHNASIPNNQGKMYLISYPSDNHIINNNIGLGIEGVSINLDYNVMFDVVFDGVNIWYKKNKNNPKIKANFDKLLKVGYPPNCFLGGIKFIY